VQIDTNIDDMNPQFYADVSDRLFAAGALDVWLTPVQMKKGRPAVVLSVLAPAAHEVELSETILRETTTLGVRVHPVHRHEAARETASVESEFGSVTVKLKRMDGAIVSAAPEYDDCRLIAAERGLPVRQVHEAAIVAAQKSVANGHFDRPSSC
jgi:uncharacterized protein (DUF111 family)